ncbi:hypothetical protein BJY01DRAFT_225997 [Aspergillus pseudoustus]|uniref:Uncharacterized protein n=1 Tax=Aspergillus pseudoustus TaxID=1810923 RepID=A0ABR4IWX9_9EURO
MSALFGRRHSVAGGSPADNDALPAQMLRRRSSAPSLGEHDTRFQARIRDFFRRYRRPSEDSGKEPVSSSRTPRQGVSQSPIRPSGARDRKRDSDTSSEGSPEYELTRNDIEVIFSGAPYFLLEKGKQEYWYPHVIFPFDDHDPTIQSLWDRRILPYPSYTLSTLHAHLPIPGEWMIEGDTPVQLDSWTRMESPKRASFDLGMFEVPNMLSSNGKEPGSVGLHYFLELPVADAVRFTGPPRATAEADFLRLSGMPAMEAYGLMEHHSLPYALCKDGTVHDRKKLLLDGPTAWKRIGVRDIDLQKLVARLQTLKQLRYDILHGNTAKTILDLEGTLDLFTGLFNNFLYRPPRFMTVEGEDPHSVQSQIKALTVVLATPGAWFDFSLPEWRLRIGQILWEASPHGDGDFIDPSTSEKPWSISSLERKWFLVQMLLAAELLLRLDGTVRVGLLEDSENLQISRRDIQDFQRLQTAKVNWDVVAVRRLMDSFSFSYRPAQPEQAALHPTTEPHHEKLHHFSFKHLHKTQGAAEAHESAWACELAPDHIDRQLEGLLFFADNIGWPNIGGLKQHFRSIRQNGKSQAVIDTYNQPIKLTPSPGNREERETTMYSRSPSYRPLVLQPPASSGDSILVGWITRTWLSGLILPGEGINHFLISSILENDVEALAKLGSVANIYGGFSYSERSWWSQECIVGRVLSPLQGTNTCMGWIASDVLPRDSKTSKLLENTWFEIISSDPPACPGGPRIKQGKKISLKSTPLGLGDLTSGAFSLPVDDPKDRRSKAKIEFHSLAFDVQEKVQEQQQAGGRRPVKAQKATTVFSLRAGRRRTLKSVSFPLVYNVRFISSQECRPPSRLVSYSTPGAQSKSSSTSSSPIRRKHLPRLPGHPLHSSYAYRVINIDSLREFAESESGLATLELHRAVHWHDIMVVDARGGPDQEAFARAWCSSVGYDAVVGRVNRTCLACCIREARAVKVRVVIRVGDGCPSHASSRVNRSASFSRTAKPKERIN